jgi:hypothetical protein
MPVSLMVGALHNVRLAASSDRNPSPADDRRQLGDDLVRDRASRPRRDACHVRRRACERTVRDRGDDARQVVGDGYVEEVRARAARDAKLLPEPDVDVQVASEVDRVETVALAVVPRIEISRVDEALALVGMAGAERDPRLRHDLHERADVDGLRVEARADAARGFDVRELPEVTQARELGLKVRAVEVACVVLTRKEVGPHQPRGDLELRAAACGVVQLRPHDDARPLNPLCRLGARGRRAVLREVRVEVGISVVIADATGVHVILPNDARKGRTRRVPGREKAKMVALAKVDSVLSIDGRRLRGAVLAEALCLAQGERGERLLVRLLRRGDADDPRLAERAVGGLGLVASLGNAKVEQRASDDRRVSLAWIVRTFEHTDASHDLRDDEVGVGVSLSVNVERDVDGHLADLHLDARAVVEVEASQVDVIAEPLAVLVIDEESGGSRQHLARLLARRSREHFAIDLHISEAARRRPGNAGNVDGLDVGRRSDWGRWDRRRGAGRPGREWHRGDRRGDRYRAHGRVEDHHVLDARSDRPAVPCRRRERGRLHGIDGSTHERIGHVTREARNLDSRLHASGRIQDDLKGDLRLDGGRVGRKGGDDRRRRIPLDELRGRALREQQNRQQRGPAKLCSCQPARHPASLTSTTIGRRSTHGPSCRLAHWT